MHNLTLCSLAEISFALSDAYNIVYYSFLLHCVEVELLSVQAARKMWLPTVMLRQQSLSIPRKARWKREQQPPATRIKNKKKHKAFYIHGIGPISLAHHCHSIRFNFFFILNWGIHFRSIFDSVQKHAHPELQLKKNCQLYLLIGFIEGNLISSFLGTFASSFVILIWFLFFACWYRILFMVICSSSLYFWMHYHAQQFT